MRSIRSGATTETFGAAARIVQNSPFLRLLRPILLASIPIAAAAVLCLPLIRVEYFWDDYSFLTLRGGGSPFTYLLPRAHDTFYRPLSQGLYFLVLRTLGPSGVAGHIANLVLLAILILLLVRLVSRLYGDRAGVFAGLFMAVSGCIPSLVAWVSGSQDLLAIVFTLGSLSLRHERKELLAIVAMLAAILSKETALVALPVLLFWDSLIGRADPRLRLRALIYACIAIAWLVIHPGMRELLSRGFQSGGTAYVGIERPDRWLHYGMRYALTLVNVPPPEFQLGWERSLIAWGLVTVVFVLAAPWLLAGAREAEKQVPWPRTILVAGLLVLPSLLIPTIAVRYWATYLAGFAVAGLAIATGPCLARCQRGVALGVVLVLLVLGIRYRSARPIAEASWTESVFLDASSSIRRVRVQFERMFPFIPPGSQILMTVGSTGTRGVQSSMIDGQALQLWYRDPSIRTDTILDWRPHAGPEFLVRITPELEVVSIDPMRREIRTATDHAPDKSEVVKPIVAYARARAAAGDIDVAVTITRGLAETENNISLRAYYLHMTASFLISAGRFGEADSILASTPRFPEAFCLTLVKRLLAEPSRSEQVDIAAFPAFGLSYDNPKTIRWMVREFVRSGFLAQAAWLARRALELDPLDGESATVLRDAEEKGIEPSRLPG